ncbi:CMRF35-like molecule 9 isoform X3 [Rhinolophus ferrumequinum]|uniref:CMRF35-like molecule 9 isoform X3 n=2 Tax=Rhinolophus ferrumequinum TaxID=59479 RepID=UPI00140F64F3|nr:CMRF35-like molecule 9 isoform X3 [Rhinolophus ferrumequinum]
MRPLVLLWGCLVLPGYGALVGPKEIRGFEGGTVSLQCTYREELRKNKKYWCRKSGLFLSRCSDPIYIDDGQEKTEGRVSVQDSPQELTLHVTLRKLRVEDTGKYWCGVKILGLDETFLVSLIVLPGPCCPPSPTPPFQPLATTSLQPNAKAWQTQLPELTSPGLHSTVTTDKQGKTEAEVFPFPETAPYDHAGSSLYTGTSPYAGASPHAATSPNEETSPHKATSPHAGTSSPATHLDATSTEDNRLVPGSSRSKSRMSRSVVRNLAPVLVLLTLLLATGLAALGRYMLQWRKKAQRAMQTQRNEKVYLSHLNGLVPEYAVINLAAPTRPCASLKSSASPYTDIQCLSQTSEEEEASFQDPERDMSPGPPPHVSEELSLSKFIAV